jgi:gliding motility-associated-like protein
VGGLLPYEIRVELDSASSFAFQEYHTNFVEVTDVSDNQQLEKIYKDLPPGRFKVQIQDSLGCSIELQARVAKDIDIFIPNVMTPNNDGSNDVFFIRNLPESGENKLIITNRWGKEVYSATGYKNNWKGEEAVDGIYYYRLQINGGTPITGWVEILRGQKP